MIRDMTKGSVTKHIIFFSLPMVIGNLFQQAYNLADTIVVGRYVGKDALAAVGASFPILFFILALIIGLSMGSSVVISQYFGAGEQVKLKRSISTSFIFLSVSSVILTILGIIISRPLLVFLQTPKGILDDADLYLKIFFSGIVLTFLYNTMSGILRGLGDSKTPLYFLILASILNVILDIVFVASFGWGVAGVAWATVIAQGVSAVSLLIYSYKKIDILRFKKHEFVFDKHINKLIVKIGVPSSMQQVIVSMGMMAMQGLVNSYGEVTIAAFTAANRLDSLAMMPVLNMGLALSSFTAQNIGAGELKRVHKGFVRSLQIAIAFSIILSVVIILFGPKLIEIFVEKKEMLVIEQGSNYIKIVSAFYFLMSIIFITNGVLRGSGDINVSMISTLVNLVIRVVSAYILASIAVFGVSSIWWSVPIGWASGVIIALWRYFQGGWKNKSIVKYNQTGEMS